MSVLNTTVCRSNSVSIIILEKLTSGLCDRYSALEEEFYYMISRSGKNTASG